MPVTGLRRSGRATAGTFGGAAMARLPPRWRALDRAEGPWSPPPIGHNKGPPLDQPNGWALHCWRRAQKAAWRSPPIEVVRRRAALAEGLGLSYRDYTAILLDSGRHPQAVLFGLGGTLVAIERNRIAVDAAGRIRPLPSVAEKLARLRNGRIFVVSQGLANAAQLRGFIEQLDALCGGVITDHRICNEPAVRANPLRGPRPGLVLDLLAAHSLPPAAAIMVGHSEGERRCAEAARLARFVWARDYFGRGPAG